MGAAALLSSQGAVRAAEAPALAAQARPGAELGEVIVTSRKREETVQSVAVSVTALDGARLARTNAKDLFQIAPLVSGVVFSRAPDDGLALTFRGLGTAARSQAFEQSVALFTDGVFVGKGRLYSTAFFDVDRMEFIKGTQSTVLGKNASLGAINVVTRQPGDAFSFEGQAGYEFIDGGYVIDAASDLPLSRKASLRLAVHDNDLGGWVHNDITDHNGPEHTDLGVRATLRVDLSDVLKVTASYQYADNGQRGASYQLVGPIPPAYGEGTLDDHTAQFTTQTASGDTIHDTASHIANIKGELQIGRFLLVSQSAYIHYDLDFKDDFDFSKDDSVNFNRREHYDQFTQEIRLQSPAGGKLDYMVGGFFLWSHWDSQEAQLWAVPEFPPPPAPITGQLFNGPFRNSYVQDSRAYSVFASGTWRLGRAIRLAGGVRYTREEKSVLYGRSNDAPLTIWNTIANPPFDPTPLSHDSDFVDGGVSLQYDLAGGVMAYLSYAHGSKSGGYVETNTVAVPPPLLVNGKVPAALVAAGSSIKDEFTDNYEAGLKTELLNHRLRINIAGFWTEIQDFQDTVFTGGTLGFITFNGPARSRGVEVESAFQADRFLRLDGALTFADATGVIQPIDPATNAPETDAAGDPVLRRYQRSQAPKFIADFSADYDGPLTARLNLRLGAHLHYRSSMFNQRQEEFLSKGLTTLDLSVGVASSDGRWGLDLTAKNVTDAISQDFASPSVDPRFGAFYGAYLAGPNPLRTVMLSVHFKY